MKFHIIYAVLICFHVLSAEAGLKIPLPNLFGTNQGTPAPLARVAEYPSLALLVGKMGECTVAPTTISKTLEHLKFEGSENNGVDKFLFVCPAENAEEDEMMKKSSVTKQMLFFRDEFQIEGNTVGNNEVDDYENNYKCVTPIKPSFEKFPVTGEPYEIFITGFEVNLKKFGNVSMPTVPGFSKPEENIYWFNVLTIMFNRDTLDVRCVSYKEVFGQLESPTDLDSSVTAADYALGKTLLYENLDIEQLYKIDNQRAVFSRLFPDETIRNNYFNETTKVLVKGHLASFNKSITGLLRQAAQTYGNIAPMWATVKMNSWYYLNQFIAKLTERLTGLHVVTGTYKILHLAGSGPIFLSEMEKVSVPLAFYKVVEFWRTKFEIFAMVIVVVNNPYESTGMLLCEEDECHKYGWEQIANSDYSTGQTYCCPLTQDIINSLQLKTNLTVNKVLDLTISSEVWKSE